jgi:hypothetical protein
MSLEKLVQLGWYKAEPTSPNEIAGLYSIVDRSLADLKVESISDDLRFQAAYNGILTLANVTLRASGFRVSLGQVIISERSKAWSTPSRRRTRIRGSDGYARSRAIRRKGTPQTMTWLGASPPTISLRF